MANNVSILCAYWPFVYLLGGKKNSYSNPSSIFSIVLIQGIKNNYFLLEGVLKFLIDFYFLSSQQNLVEGTQIPHTSSTTKHAQPPPLSTCPSRANQNVTFVLTVETTLIHHYHTNCTVYIRTHSCCTFNEFGQMDNHIYPSLYYHSEWFHCPKYS